MKTLDFSSDPKHPLNQHVKNMNRTVKRSAQLFAAVAITAAVVWYVLKIFEFSLRVSVNEDGAVLLQTLSLGEYYTPVTLFEIYESNSGNKVVTLAAKSENSRMHTVTLRKGVNPFDDVYLDGYVVNYMDRNRYTFTAGQGYTAKVQWGMYTKEVSFVLPNGT